MLIDVHAHFYTELSNRTDWRILNQARMDAGRTIGAYCHIAAGNRISRDIPDSSRVI